MFSPLSIYIIIHYVKLLKLDFFIIFECGEQSGFNAEMKEKC